MPCCVPCCTYYFIQPRYNSKCHTRYPYYTTRLVRTTLLNKKKTLPAQLTAQLFFSSAVLRRAVRWRALRCGAVACCSALSFVHTAVPGIMQSIRYQVTVQFTCVLLVDLLSRSIILSRPSSYCIFPFASCTRTANENVTSPASMQHSTGQSAVHK